MYGSVYDYCASCTYLREDADSYGKYYCENKGERVPACDPKCRSYCEAYSRSRSGMENMYDNSHDHQSSGCYITTMLCGILEMNDNNYFLKKLRGFRNTYMQCNPNNLPLLATYDVYGPLIAKKLNEDEENKKVSLKYLQQYIVPAVMAIESENYEEAKNIYTEMTTSLAIRYNIKMEEITAKDLEGIKPIELGHGKVRILKPRTNN